MCIPTKVNRNLAARFDETLTPEQRRSAEEELEKYCREIPNETIPNENCPSFKGFFWSNNLNAEVDPVSFAGFQRAAPILLDIERLRELGGNNRDLRQGIEVNRPTTATLIEGLDQMATFRRHKYSCARNWMIRSRIFSTNPRTRSTSNPLIVAGVKGLRRIFLTPFLTVDPQYEWIVYAARYDDVIFLKIDEGTTDVSMFNRTMPVENTALRKIALGMDPDPASGSSFAIFNECQEPFVATHTNYTIKPLNRAGSATETVHNLLTISMGMCFEQGRGIHEKLTTGMRRFVRSIPLRWKEYPKENLETWATCALTGAQAIVGLLEENLENPNQNLSNVECLTPDQFWENSTLYNDNEFKQYPREQRRELQKQVHQLRKLHAFVFLSDFLDLVRNSLPENNRNELKKFYWPKASKEVREVQEVTMEAEEKQRILRDMLPNDFLRDAFQPDDPLPDNAAAANQAQAPA